MWMSEHFIALVSLIVEESYDWKCKGYEKDHVNKVCEVESPIDKEEAM